MKRLTDIAVPIALLSLSGLAMVFVALPVAAACKGLEMWEGRHNG